MSITGRGASILTPLGRDLVATEARQGKRSVGAPIAPQLQWVNDPGWAGEMAGGCDVPVTMDQ